MEDYIVSARKYRPATFNDVIGQNAITTTLKNTVKSGNLAHAYLFCGPRGVGKTTCARIFAKAINCMNPTADGESCNECESCKSFNEQRSFNIFELDAASNNKVDDIRLLMEQTRIPPQVGKYKVFIIDEVHMLTQAAFNAFLKTLEEPPAHVIFILATTEKQKILPTIISRCQIFDFERMAVPDIIKHLKSVAEKENITYEDDALSIIAEKADGGMRDALSIFDQVTSYCQGNITYHKVIEDLNVLDTDNYFNIINYAVENKACEIMLLLDSITSKGFDGGNLIIGLASHVRNILMAKDEKTLPLLETSDNFKNKYREQAKICDTRFLYSALKILTNCDINYKQSNNKRLLVEITLIDIAQITQQDTGKDSDGRSPRKLKILFQKLRSSSQNRRTLQVAPAGSTVQHTPEDTNSRPNHMESTNSTPSTIAKKNVIPESISGIGFTFSKLKTDDSAIDTVDEITDDPDSYDNIDEPQIIDEPFSQDDLIREWNVLCNSLPKEQSGLAIRLKNIVPSLSDDLNVEIVAENEIILGQIESFKTFFKTTLTNNLHNNKIKIITRLANDEEIKASKSKKEILQELKKDNSPLDFLLKRLQLILEQ